MTDTDENSGKRSEGIELPSTEDAEDPYQHNFGPYHNDDWFRHQFKGVEARAECLVCKGSIPWSNEFSWKYVQAGGCVEGPFCSRRHMWRWMNGDR